MSGVNAGTRPNTVRLDQRGQALLQALVTLGVMSVMIVTFMKMTDDQRQNSLRLQQKLAALDLQRTLTLTLQDGQVCDWIVNNPTLPAFDPTEFSSGNKNLTTLAHLRAFASPTARIVVKADGQTPVSALDENLAVKSIFMNDVTCVPAPCTVNSNVFNANITLNFNARRLIMPLAPLKFPILLVSSGPPAKQTIQSCSSRTSLKTVTVWSSTQSCGGDPSYPNCPNPSQPAVAACPAGYMVTGCGFNLSQWSPYPSGKGNNPNSNSPDKVDLSGNGCAVWAGVAPACGVCFQAQTMCIQMK